MNNDLNNDPDNERVGDSQIPDSANNEGFDPSTDIIYVDNMPLIVDSDEIPYDEPIIYESIPSTYGPPPHWEEEEKLRNLDLNTIPEEFLPYDLIDRSADDLIYFESDDDLIYFGSDESDESDKSDKSDRSDGSDKSD
ncbi:MAG: hypothetical protein K2I48_04005 [Muribaculaceae bacterium]|nr:hypothetical protein [Muribaculaceae bacterium]